MLTSKFFFTGNKSFLKAYQIPDSQLPDLPKTALGTCQQGTDDKGSHANLPELPDKETEYCQGVSPENVGLKRTLGKTWHRRHQIYSMPEGRPKAYG